MRFLLDALLAHARRHDVHWQPSLITPDVNTIALEAQLAGTLLTDFRA